MEDDYRSNGSADAASQEGGSDNDMDETMRDVDAEDDERQDEEIEDNDEDGEGDGEGDGDNENDNEDETAERVEETEGQTSSQTAEPQQVIDHSHPRPEVLTASTYDIVPTIAAPQSTSINAICGTADSRWIFTGGADGYIRQYNWVESVNGKTQLTVAQRHPFVDSVVKAGVLMTYWENYDARKATPESTVLTTTTTLSPVYSLACQSSALWMAAGTASGAIRLQSVRHEEGHQIALLQQHKSAVSVLSLASDEKSLLSGSWDKSVIDWDLDTGQVKTSFAPSGGQISCIEPRPISSVPVPFESGEVVKIDTTFTANNAAEVLQDGENGIVTTNGQDAKEATTPDSLFGGDEGDDDLFGDNADTGLNGNAFGFDESEMNQTAEDGPAPENGGGTDLETLPHAAPVQPSGSPQKLETSTPELPVVNGAPNTAPQTLANGLPHAEDMEQSFQNSSHEDDRPVTSDSTFMAASIDGSIRVWDRRAPLPVARITPYNTPPWCLSACWSPDGNYIYAGRRNNTVEEYDLRKGLKKPERVFRYPQGSGPVTSVKAMPNGRHLICASYDILRLYDLQHSSTNKTTMPFLIVPGHRTGTISHLYLSADCRYMMSTGGNRGWDGTPTEVLLGYEIGVPSSG